MSSTTSAPAPSVDVVTRALEDAGVFPDILPLTPLKGTLEIIFPSGVSVTAGQSPHRDEVLQEPRIRFHPADALDTSATYTLIMTDPDLMKTNDPLDKQVRHWVQPGLSPSASGELTASRGAHTTFLGSAPMPMTGPHRYVFILGREPSSAQAPTFGERGGDADFKDRLRFQAADFIKEHNLEVVGVAFMKVAPTAGAGAADAKLMAQSALHMVTGS